MAQLQGKQQQYPGVLRQTDRRPPTIVRCSNQVGPTHPRTSGPQLTGSIRSKGMSQTPQLPGAPKDLVWA